MAEGSRLEDPLDEKNIKFEAEEAVKEIRFAVKEAHISNNLESTCDRSYINLATLEGLDLCVQVSASGYQVVGTQFDTIQEQEENPFYETINALLDVISPGYRQMFGNALIDKLATLNQSQEGGQNA